jgi:hypothetical protein
MTKSSFLSILAEVRNGSSFSCPNTVQIPSECRPRASSSVVHFVHDNKKQEKIFKEELIQWRSYH